MAQLHLLFDFGGVLVDLDRARCVQAFERLGFDVQHMLGTYKQGGVLQQLERGDTDVAGFCREMRRAAGSHHTPDADIVAAWESYLTEVPAERLDMLLKIRRHYPVSVLSNTNVIHWQQACQQFFRYKGLGIDDFFDHKFLSYEMGVEKPDPAIFHAVVAKMQVPAEDILFLDDSAENCEAARRCGMKAVVAPAHSGWLPLFDDDGRLTMAL